MTEIYENCCRVCLKREQIGSPAQFRDIRDASFGEFSPLEVLNQLFSLKIDPSVNGHLPQKICSFCSAKLTISVEVWTLALESQNCLEEHTRTSLYEEHDVPTIETVPTNIDKPEPKLIEQMRTTFAEIEVPDIKFEPDLLMPFSLSEALETQREESDISIQNDEIVLQTNSNVHEKRKSSTRNSNLLKKLIPNQSTGKVARKKSVACSRCERVFATPGFLNRHLFINFNSKMIPFECAQCKEEFKYECQLYKHYQETKHIDPAKKFECRECGNMYKNSYILNSHMKVHSRKGIYVCKLCGLQYATKRRLQAHLRFSHDGVSLVEAMICKRKDLQP